MRILLIHAGGYSQRQPNASISGKLFVLVPQENSQGGPKTVFELKLEVYQKFLTRMRPGVFLAASDALEGFQLTETDEWNFENEGFTVLAHPSPLSIGKDHGVYIFESNVMSEKPVSIAVCKRVLQKPSLDLMRESGAVIRSLSGGGDSEEFVYTDSAFFFSASVARRLLEFYEKESPILYELDCYGDFLQPLGKDASADYVTDLSRVSLVDCSADDMSAIRKRLFHALRNFDIRAVVIQNSKFYHLGTLPELIQNYTDDEEFSTWFDTRTVSFSVVPSELKSQGCIMQSIFGESSVLPQKSIVEYCSFDKSFSTVDGTVLSNCRFQKQFAISIPVLIFTVPIRSTEYVSVVFGTFDDIKKTSRPSRIHYMGDSLSLESFLEDTGIPFNPDCETSLWNARLFVAESSMESSFERALDHLARKPSPANATYLSMHDLLKLKNVDRILDYRNALFLKICDKRTRL